MAAPYQPVAHQRAIGGADGRNSGLKRSREAESRHASKLISSNIGEAAIIAELIGERSP